MFAIFVLKFRLPPLYVLDEMTMFEFEKLLEYSFYAHQDEWEQCRFNSYVNVQMNTKKKLKPQDILQFTWDKNNNTKRETIVSEKDKNRLREFAKKQEEILNKNGKQNNL